MLWPLDAELLEAGNRVWAGGSLHGQTGSSGSAPTKPLAAAGECEKAGEFLPPWNLATPVGEDSIKETQGATFTHL